VATDTPDSPDPIDVMKFVGYPGLYLLMNWCVAPRSGTVILSKPYCFSRPILAVCCCSADLKFTGTQGCIE
jgi:hypothetical protein